MKNIFKFFQSFFLRKAPIEEAREEAEWFFSRQKSVYH